MKREKSKDMTQVTQRKEDVMDSLMEQPTKRRAQPLSEAEKAHQQAEKEAAKLHKEEAAEAKRVQQQQEEGAKAAAKSKYG